jgi:hypothetical protein
MNHAPKIPVAHSSDIVCATNVSYESAATRQGLGGTSASSCLPADSTASPVSGERGVVSVGGSVGRTVEAGLGGHDG